MDTLLNELRGSIRTRLQEGEWKAIQYFGERCAESAARKRIAALGATLASVALAYHETNAPMHHGSFRECDWPICRNARAALEEAT
jgi:hypothetical protein